MLHQQAVEKIFHALADPHRLSMVETLSKRGRSLGSLASGYDMSLTAVGQHVKILEQAGLVLTEKVGRTRMCSVAPTAFDSIDQWVRRRREMIERRMDRLEAHLAKLRE